MQPSPQELEFRFDSGRICLDFVATLASRNADTFERWRDRDDLERWLRQSGLVPTGAALDKVKLGRARGLREAIYRAVQARRAGAAPKKRDVALINKWADRRPPTPLLDEAGARVTLAARKPFGAALSTIARDAVDLITGPQLDRVRECDEHTCSILFVDTSRPGTRRWCSMNRCGNKVKKAAFRERHAT